MNRFRTYPWQLSVVLTLFCIADGALAHDFWIEPATYRPARGSVLPVRLRVGDRFRGEPYSRNPRHLKRFVLAGPEGGKSVEGRPGSEPAGRVPIEESGSLILGYRSNRTLLSMEADRFEAYLNGEGLERIVRLRALRGETGKPAREAFSRCAKAVILSGPDRDTGHDRILGFTLELVPERNPYALRPGDDLPVRVLYRGAPLKGARIAALNAADPNRVVEARSNAQGRVRLPLHRGGLWLIKTVHMVPAPEEIAADWESFWASLTFHLKETGVGGQGPGVSPGRSAPKTTAGFTPTAPVFSDP